MIARTVVTTPTELVEQNLLVAQSIAFRLKRNYPWLDPEDTYSYSLLGLTLAARCWRPERGLAFGAFAGHKAMFLAIDQMRHDGLLRRKGTGRSPEVSPGDGRRGLSPHVDPVDPVGQEGQKRVDARDLLDHLLGALPMPDRNLLAMYYADGLTFAEIGAVLGLSPSAVSVQHAALMKSLRRKTWSVA